MNKILFRKKLLASALLAMLSLIAHAQQPSTQVKTLKLTVVNPSLQKVLETGTSNSVNVYTTIAANDSSRQAATTAWTKVQLYAQSEGLFKRYAIPFGSSVGKLSQDSTNFNFQSGNIYVGNGSLSTNSIILNAGRTEIQGSFSGFKFNVGSGFAGGGVYDASKGYIFQNRGNSYLTIATAGSIHTSTFFTDLVINGTIKITGGSPGLGKVLTGTDAIGNATWQTASGGVKDTTFITNASQSIIQVVTTGGKDSLGFKTQTQNKFLASPQSSTGEISARAIVAADIPSLSYASLASMRSFANSVLIGTNANITAVAGTHYILSNGVLTANRTINVSGLSSSGDYISIHNLEAGKLWSFTGGTVYQSNGTTPQGAILYNVTTEIRNENGVLTIQNY